MVQKMRARLNIPSKVLLFLLQLEIFAGNMKGRQNGKFCFGEFSRTRSDLIVFSIYKIRYLPQPFLSLFTSQQVFMIKDLDSNGCVHLPLPNAVQQDQRYTPKKR